jgi:hypothetical protein
MFKQESLKPSTPKAPINLTEDEFESWLGHPVTQIVFEKLKEHIREAEAAWMNMSWRNGKVDPVLLADLRARAMILQEIVTLKHEDIL